MTHPRAWLASAAVAALVFGLDFPDPNLVGGRAPPPQDFTLLAANETRGTDQRHVQSEQNADESAKMGEKSATHTGDECVSPEKDTERLDQPPRQNPTTSN